MPGSFECLEWGGKYRNKKTSYVSVLQYQHKQARKKLQVVDIVTPISQKVSRFINVKLDLIT